MRRFSMTRLIASVISRSKCKWNLHLLLEMTQKKWDKGAEIAKLRQMDEFDIIRSSHPVSAKIWFAGDVRSGGLTCGRRGSGCFAIV